MIVYWEANIYTKVLQTFILLFMETKSSAVRNDTLEVYIKIMLGLKTAHNPNFRLYKRIAVKKKLFIIHLCVYVVLPLLKLH